MLTERSAARRLGGEVDAEPPLGTGFGARIAYLRRDRVIGELRVGSRHRAEDGTVHLGTILGFAEELVARGSLSHHGEGEGSVTIETKANLFAPTRTELLGGEAVPLHTGDGLLVWQVTVSEAGGATIASVSQTRRITAQVAQRALPGAFPAPEPPPAAAAPVSVAEKRREQIAAAACEVIARKGFANATIREIAEAAGLHVPTLYQYVASKDEVLELVYAWVMERLGTDVDAATAGCTSAREKLLATVAAMVADGDRYRRQVGVLNRELKSLPPKARLRVLGIYRQLLDRVAAIIAEGVTAGEFRPVEPAIVANFVEALCDVWPLRQFSVGGFPLETFQREIAGFVEASLARRP